jgi:predicted  nucleic acid-binding Zn-ribbon protein
VPSESVEVAGESDAAFERAKLELRIKELSEQLSEATSRAAALHYRLAQVAEDRNALEMNLSGERGANLLSQQVIVELRQEVEQLKAAAAQAGKGRA